MQDAGRGAIDPQRLRGFHPFWFWNDELDEAEIRRQVAEMAEQGVKGFFIHPRQGLKTPYLSEPFFEAVAAAVDEAAKRGLAAHLYDEYPYPSGVAGGAAILGNPHFYATTLLQRTYDLQGGAVRLRLPAGKVLNCTAYPLQGGAVHWDGGIDLLNHVGVLLADESYQESGLTAYSRKRYFASGPVPTLDVALPERPWRLFVSIQAEVDGHKYWGRFLDVLNPAAVQAFMRLTHERYLSRFGSVFGRQIPSIFVDETAPGWSERMPAAFKQTYGYDLLPLLPALQDPSHPEHARVAKDLHSLRLRLFCETFEEPVSRWCKEHNILYTGEKPSLRFSQLRFYDWPGCDAGHTRAGAPWDLLGAELRHNARATASAAYLYGKIGSLCECYHSLSWGATLQDAKVIAEGLLLMGIETLVPHGFFYSTHALRKHDAPPSFFFQMPYWPHFGRLARRIGRIQESFSGSHIDAKILVIDPAAGLPDRAQKAQYAELLEALFAAHLECLIGDVDALAESKRIERDGGAALRLRDVEIEAVVAPPMRSPDPEQDELLRAFEDAGGLVARVKEGEPPEAVCSLLRRRVGACLPIRAVQGDAGRLRMVRRKDGERTIWFVLNPWREELEIEIEAPSPLREIALEDGAPPLLRRTGAKTYRRKVGPFESFLLETAPAEESGGGRLPVVQARVDEMAVIRPLQPNLLRLDDWEMSFAGGGGARKTRAVPLINQLAESEAPFAPKVELRFGLMPRNELPEMEVEYAARFDADGYSGEARLVMEPDSIEGEWTVQVNGSPLFGPEAFKPVEAHVRGFLGIDIAPWLQPGKNLLRVRVKTGSPSGGLRNPLYLAGGFAVYAQEGSGAPVLAPMPWAGRIDDWEGNGLPYYAGTVEYETTAEVTGELSAAAGGDVLAEIHLPATADDAYEISFNDGEWLPLLWRPRRARLAASRLRPGRNRVRLRVHTALQRAFDGEWFDYEAHRVRPVEPAPRPRGR